MKRDSSLCHQKNIKCITILINLSILNTSIWINTTNPYIWSKKTEKIFLDMLESYPHSHHLHTTAMSTLNRKRGTMSALMTDKFFSRIEMNCICNITMWALFKMPTILTDPSSRRATTIIENIGFLIVCFLFTNHIKHLIGDIRGNRRGWSQWYKRKKWCRWYICLIQVHLL